MSTYTTNYNLEKPDSGDQFQNFRALFNGNMDKIDKGLGNINIADKYDNTSTYAVGDYVIYEGLLYKCTTAVTIAENFDNTKWTQVLVTNEMGGGSSYIAGDGIKITGSTISLEYFSVVAGAVNITFDDGN